MSKITRATRPEELDAISDMLHDRWFDVEDISYDPARQLLSVPFERPAAAPPEVLWRFWPVAKIRVAMTRAWLHVSHVVEYELIDEHQVGNYNFNEVIYNREQRKVTITTGIPLVLRAAVTALDVSIEETDTLVANEIRLTLAWLAARIRDWPAPGHR